MTSLIQHLNERSERQDLVIQTSGLERVFRTRDRAVTAVTDLDLTVSRGEIVGFLGPNGAGKTTTLRMLTTLLSPTAGEATVAGCDLRRDAVGVRKRVGYIPQGGSTEPGLRVGEELVQQGRLYHMPSADAAQRAVELCGHLKLDQFSDHLVKTLSGGQRRRLEVALGLMHRPELIFLDEPTSGLDPQSRSDLWDHIRSLRATHDATVFLSTHYLEEADALCDRLLIIDHGRLVAEGSPEELKRRIGGHVITVEADDVEQARSALSHLDGERTGIRDIAVTNRAMRITVDSGDAALVALMQACGSANVQINAIQLYRPTLDDVFFALTGRSLRDEETPKKTPAEEMRS